MRTKMFWLGSWLIRKSVMAKDTCRYRDSDNSCKIVSVNNNDREQILSHRKMFKLKTITHNNSNKTQIWNSLPTTITIGKVTNKSIVFLFKRH